MASHVIHMCVAKRIGEKLNINNNEFLLGSIAPDLSKILNQNKVKSHFLDVDGGIPNIDKFIDKYGKQINKPFILGYYIHLYTDKMWFDGFIDKLILEDNIRLLDGTVIKTSYDEIKNLIYNDYTNLNIQLLDYYNLDLSLFYNEVIIPDVFMDEIDISQINKLVEKTGIIIENTKESKEYLFDIYSIKMFIDLCVEKIYDEILKLEFYNSDNNFII